MKHVDIYITHNMASLKAARAAYVYVICADTSKGNAACGEFGIEQDVTVNRINLYALRSALGHFIKPAEITIYTDSPVVAGAFNCGNLDKWIKNGFHTARGQLVSNTDLWRSIADRTCIHIINAVMTKEHAYTDWAQKTLLQKYGNAQ